MKEREKLSSKEFVAWTLVKINGLTVVQMWDSGESEGGELRVSIAVYERLRV